MTQHEQNHSSSQAERLARSAKLDSDASILKLERDIEETQRRLERDIDELTQRFDPRQLKDRLMARLHEIPGDVQEVLGTLAEKTKEGGAAMLDSLKHNPLPSALIGAGLGLVVAGSVSALRARQPSHADKDYGQFDHLNSYEDDDYDEFSESESAEHSALKNEAALGERVVDGVKQLGSSTVRQAEQLKVGTAHWLDERPLAVGAVALLAGAVVGFLLPRSSYENRMLGPKRDELIHGAGEKLGEVVEAVKETVKEKAQEVKDGLQNEFAKTPSVV
jgi:ElaB/YqjD/DUF883 family membrane-anchored ribosome-binding protein